MKFEEFIGMFDNYNGTTKVNDNNLNCIIKGKTWDIAHMENLHNMEVVAFGFYDNELCVRVKEPTTENKISWDRLSELATDAIYGMFEAEPYDAVEFCREKDLSETEIEYLIADCHKKYFKDEETENDDYEVFHYRDAYGL